MARFFCSGRLTAACCALTIGVSQTGVSHIFTMYAVIETGGKQYRVAVGDRLRVESLSAAQGDSVKLDKVLLVAGGEGEILVGTPHLPGGAVTATVVGHGRGDKVHVFKMRRRKNYRRSQGHRQGYTELRVTAIHGDDAKPAPTPAAAEAEAGAEK